MRRARAELPADWLSRRRSVKADVTTPPPPKPSTSPSISQEWDIHGTRRSPAFAPLCCYSLLP
jgi:hypothetical protein